MQSKFSRNKGFRQAVTLMKSQIRKAGETRGFADTQVLTHWPDIVGADIAQHCRPVDVRFAKGGLGATLTVLVNGPFAPMLEMQKEAIRDKVNAIYGYSAISKVRLTQTSATGFAEAQAAFHGPKSSVPPVNSGIEKISGEITKDVGDANLRRALADLAKNVLSKRNASI